MARGFEVIVRPMIFPDIRPAPARSLPPEDDPEKGIAVIHGASGQHVDLPYSWGFNMSKSQPVEVKREESTGRTYQKNKSGQINRNNYVDTKVASRIMMDESTGTLPIRKLPAGAAGFVQTQVPQMRTYHFARLQEADNIEILESGEVTKNEGYRG